ncbi:hypothetical protein [Sphingomonas sp. SRS2]|uniref:hypothetical protein n=1 Tax=Sphingomonas sp. SRS2 TaxID=133190 RepID=UPI0006184AFC|nr:hypothetical protein [Sphingomonas sp. SRS2]KKC24876.1 hypothetical protein WP12_16745 [Sphingomonas sp. SRS2]
MNESKKGRDGWLMCGGRRIYHIYKQAFPMTYWYALDAAANREDSDPASHLDVRTLPAKYRDPIDERLAGMDCGKGPLNAACTDIYRHQEQFRLAIEDGYDLAAHATDQHRLLAEEWERDRLARTERAAAAALAGDDDDDVPF